MGALVSRSPQSTSSVNSIKKNIGSQLNTYKGKVPQLPGRRRLINNTNLNAVNKLNVQEGNVGALVENARNNPSAPAAEYILEKAPLRNTVRRNNTRIGAKKQGIIEKLAGPQEAQALNQLPKNQLRTLGGMRRSLKRRRIIRK
jgi:hypothetical protein